MGAVVVFAGGPPPSYRDRAVLRERMSRLDLDRVSGIVAADSGCALAEVLGVTLRAGRDLLLGDMDSIDPAVLDRAEAAGVRIERFPEDKDATDLELALDAAVALAGPAGSVTLVGTTAGRFDHVLSMVATLASVGPVAARRAWLGSDLLHVVGSEPTVVPLPDGVTFSVLPIGGEATGVTVSGARWELRGERLSAGSSRGVSNESTGGDLTVSCRSGTLLVVVPGEVL